jgi:hypothetical protein
MDQTSESEKIFQRKKYEEIIEILLTAGYFRARINTLTEFDKVVGGLCWCITSSGEDVDVDILFRENSTIGQKIALSESIVRALRKMSCPAQLQPHQIQGGVGGSDYPAIYPVIVWLVKKFFERRQERQGQLRKFSTMQFSQNFGIANAGDDASEDLKGIVRKKLVSRAYRRVQKKNESEEVRVRSCLLEYGESFGVLTGQSGDGGKGGDEKRADRDESFVVIGDAGAGHGAVVVQSAEGKKGGTTIHVVMPADISSSVLAAQASAAGGDQGSTSSRPQSVARGAAGADSSDLTAFEKKLVQAQREASREEQALAAEVSRQEAALMQQMKQIAAEEDEVAVSGSQIGAIVGMGSSAIGSAAAAYEAELEEARKQLDASAAGGKLGQIAAFKRQQQTLQTSIAERGAEVAELQTLSSAVRQKLALLAEEREEALRYRGQLADQLTKLSAMESSASQQGELAMLKDLVALNESLKAQEAAFKASCKAQLADYNARIKELEESNAVGTAGGEEEKKFSDVEEMHAKVI